MFRRRAARWQAALVTAPYPTPNAGPGPGPDSGTARTHPRSAAASVAVTWLLVLALAGAAALASFFGLFRGDGGDGCTGGNPCNDSLIGLGVVIAAGSPWAVLVATALVCAFRLGARRPAWWVPLLGAVLLVPLWVLGAYVATLGVGLTHDAVHEVVPAGLDPVHLHALDVHLLLEDHHLQRRQQRRGQDRQVSGDAQLREQVAHVRRGEGVRRVRRGRTTSPRPRSARRAGG